MGLGLKNTALSALIIMAAAPWHALAQSDTNLLKEVVVPGFRAKTLESGVKQDIDSLSYISPLLINNIGDLLERESGMFMKNYGPGQLITPSFRGGDANHTAVFYNGAKINSPTLGTADFSLIPVNGFSSITLLNSASSTAFGSGGIGGGIYLNNQLTPEKDTLILQAGIGSFNQHSLSIVWQHAWLGDRLSIKVSADRVRQENNFEFLNVAQPPEPYPKEVRLFNAFDRNTAQVNTQLQLWKSSSLQWNTWGIASTRQLPKTINTLETFSQLQSDSTLRNQFIFNWSESKRHAVDVMLFHEWTTNNYSDSIAGIDNSNEYQNLQAVANWKWEWSRIWVLNSQGAINHTVASSENFDDQENLGNASLLTKLAWSPSKLVVEIGNRLEVFQSEYFLLPFASMVIKPHRRFSQEYYLSIDRSARFPTLNEFFWNPGGNQDLQPETGLTMETGVKNNWRSWSYSFSFYINQIQNRIRWLPDGGFFSPINISESRSIGSDNSLSFSYEFRHNIRLKTTVNYSFIHAVGKIVSVEDWNALSFVPRHSVSSRLAIAYQRLSLSLAHQFVERRFITNDESSFMPSYDLFHLFAEMEFKKLSVNFGVQNLLGVDYQVMPWRPMPGRSFAFSISKSL